MCGVGVGVTVNVAVGSGVGNGVIVPLGGRIYTISVSVCCAAFWLLSRVMVSTSPFLVTPNPAGAVAKLRATGRADGVPLTVSVRTSSLPTWLYWLR